MRKIFKMALVVFLLIGLVACTTPKKDDEVATDKISIGFVTDIGGIDDKSFNQTSYEGIKKYAAEAGLVEGEDYKYLISTQAADYEPNLDTFANEEVDIIVAAGFLFADSIAATVEKYPDQKILIIDVDWLEGENLQQAVFAEHEGSFLVGVVAGLTAKEAGKDTVGFVLGMFNVTMDKFWAGYQQGVWAVCPECTILYDDANDFGSPELGKTLAAKQYNAGAYIIYHAAGGTGNGVISEAAERRAAGEDVWVCGVDTDQFIYGIYNDDGDSAVLTSMLKRVDVAAYNAVKSVADGTFEGGVIRYTLATDGVGIPAENPNVSADILAQVEEYKAKIISGEIVVSEVGIKAGEDPRIK